MNYQQLVESGYKYVCLQHNTGKSIASILKIAVVTDKVLEGYEFDLKEGENKDIAVYNQV